MSGKYDELTNKCDKLEKICEEQLVKFFLLKCNECDVEFETGRGLKKHKLIVHVKQGVFKCELCELEFKEEWKYEGHRKFCEKNSCDLCDKKFKSENILKKHKLVTRQNKNVLSLFQQF